MNSLQERATPTLLSDFIWQFPLQPATFAACPVCKDTMGGRGGWYCRNCIKNELIKRGVNKNRLNDLEQRLVRAQVLQQEIRDLGRELGAALGRVVAIPAGRAIKTTARNITGRRRTAGLC